MLDTLCHTWWHPKIVGVARSRLARWSRCGVLCTTAIERSSWLSSRVPDALPKGRSRLLLKFSQSPSLTFNTRPTQASPWKPSQIMLRRRWELLSPLFAPYLVHEVPRDSISWDFITFFFLQKSLSLISCLASNNRCQGWMLVCGIICLVA